jgi:outer membrane biogenesis lipoprotein LolB
MTKTINVVLIAAASLLFTACTSSSLPVNAQTPSFKAGSQDGCATASGAYTKNSASFSNDKDYQNGWFYGRKKCNPAQAK